MKPKKRPRARKDQVKKKAARMQPQRMYAMVDKASGVVNCVYHRRNWAVADRDEWERIVAVEVREVPLPAKRKARK